LLTALLLVSLSASLCASRAEEPVKLALVSPNITSFATSSPISVSLTNTIKPDTQNSSANTNSLSLSFKEPASKTSTLLNPILSPTDDLQSAARVVVVIKKNPEASGFFSGQSGNGSFGFSSIQAGYGQAYDSDSIVLRGRNGTAWEETRYFFFKKVVKF